MSLIELRNVTKTFTSGAESVTPVSGLDFDVEAGEFVCLMGPSGSGKTTLLHMLAGIDRPTDGSVVVNGERVQAAELDHGDSALRRDRQHARRLVFQRDLHQIQLRPTHLEREARAHRIGAASEAVENRQRRHQGWMESPMPASCIALA